MNKVKLRVKELLKEKGITQKEFAEKLGMTEVGLSKAINEDGNPPLKRLIEIADALEVEITELFATPKQSTFSCPKCGANLAITEV
ncbi:helix-turn-helix domain-containing protein [Dysgonomonas macrotermitis]|uniref:Helix-turn-helix n=1 Tax=Dysgonomonas macrotermitis TaxID=1346286 RepID=A0A1M4SCA7_9BACT|nr:helix-turn-helix transcriptional regulator [Dysgonomonas macrotermitis]SHE29830.1 Helix-turn-helix [Dysgonomonas macrotermitis]